MWARKPSGSRTAGLSRHQVNRIQTALLLLFLAAYPALLGWMVWGGNVVVWLALFGIGFALFSPVNSPQLVMRLVRAKPLTVVQAPRLHEMVAVLARRAGLAAVPVLYYIPSNQVNAFAVGRNGEAAIAVSSGLTRLLDHDEVAGVMAHEISHLRNDDIRVMSLAALSGRVTAMFSLFGQLLLLFSLPLLLVSQVHVNWMALLLLIFAPQLSVVAQLGLSRVREYRADLSAVELTGEPQSLASALWKIDRSARPLWRRLLPMGRVPDWLSTHPPVAERIRRLQELGAGNRFQNGPDMVRATDRNQYNKSRPFVAFYDWHRNNQRQSKYRQY